jgi:TolB-like protein/serine/threonine protein kinase/Tfp pilus assembly protein PilF
MTPERWQHIEEIFQTALDLAPGERELYLTNACTGDAELQREVETLLTQYEAAGDFIDEPLYQQSGVQALASLINDAGDPMLGLRVGSYLIESEIGRGGMGAVYLATRADNAFQKRVAIKVVKRGMDTDFILRRFRHERQILANLDHPHIARLLDGGATDDGRPYFVMEYIEGHPLYHYCDGRRLNVRERLRLFCYVCEAVEYAHRNQVVHRDIKPSNILVNTAGMPKLFDFGIAKLLDPEMVSDTAPQTATAMRLMTVEYASPEQVQGLPVTFLSDLYSLGVLLYELLAGHRPYRFRNRMLHEMARVICEEDPELPSVAVNRSDSLLPVTHVDQEAMTIGHLCEMRSETPDSLRRELQGSLDNITLKALSKDPAQRYQSAAALREDVMRYLEGRPVSAPVYVPLAARLTHAAPKPPAQPTEISIAVMPFKMIGAQTAADTGDEYLGIGLADALITRLSNVQRFIVRPTSSVLQYTKLDDPLEAGRSLAVDYVIDGNIRRAGETLRLTVQLLNVSEEAARWAGKFDEKFTDVLLLEDLISEQVAVALIPQLTGEEQQLLSKRGTNNPEAFDAYLRGRYHWNAPSDESLARALAFYNRAVSLDPNYALAYAGIADYYNMLGVYGMLPFAEAAGKAKEAALKAVALDATRAAGYAALGFATLMHDFDWKGAEEYLRHAVSLNPNYALGRLWYGYFFALAGRTDEALTHARRALELDPATPMVQHSANWVFYLLRLYDEAIDAARRTASNDPQYGLSYVFLCIVMSHTGGHEEAIAAGYKSIELLGRTPYMLTRLASAYAAAGRREPALKLLEEIKGMAATRYVSPNMLATVYLHLKDYDHALTELERALEIRDARIIWLGVDPQFDVLRGNPRFKNLLRRTNNPAPQPHLNRLSTSNASGNKKVYGERVTGESPTGQKSIGVLPFKMIGANKSDTGDEYLGIGLADALITRLSNVQRFIVRPTSSVLQYAETGDPLRAGSELDVEYIVDGNIRRVGATLRVSAQLFSTSDGATRWSERFDEKFTDVLQLEDILSGKIAGVLIPQLTGEEQQRLAKRGTDDPQALKTYLRARYYWHSLSEEGFAKAIQGYQRAIELDPNYAMAYAGIADYYIFLGIYCIMPFAESSLAAKQAAQKAVELDDTLAEAHAALAFALVSHDLNWEGAEEHYKRAIKLNPNSVTAHNWYCFRLLQEARFEEALAEINRALELDPVTPVVQQSLAWCHYHSRRFEEAVAVHRKLILSEPRFAWGRLTYSWALIAAGMFEEAVEQAEKAKEFGGETVLYLSGLGGAYAAAGRHEEVRAVIERLGAMSATHYVSPYFLAMIYCHLGDRERAMAYLDESLTINDTWSTWLIVEPQFDALRAEPRFSEFVRRTKNPAAPRQLVKQAEQNAEKSIAVLPFKLINIATGGNTDERYLGIGLADALITRLSNVRSLSVRPTSAILRYGDDGADTINAGRELNVNFILDGRIKQAGERIRISLQLLDVRRGASVWAHQFDERFTDVLSLEDAISEHVAVALISQLTSEERRQLKKRGTDNPEAFEAYLRGRYYWNTFTVEGFAKALLCYTRAVAHAPDYALAYTGIADYYTFLGVYAVLPFSETSASAKEAALKAVELDDELAEGYSALGIATMLHDFDWQAAGRHLKRAVELNPNYAMGHSWYCYYLGMLGRFDEAFREVRRALEIDPLTPILQHTQNWTYYYARRYEECIASTRKLISNEPQYGLAYVILCMVLWQTGAYQEAVEAGERGITLIGRSPYTLVWLASAHAAAGQEEQARSLLDEIQEMSATRYVSPYLLAMVYCNLNDTEQAFRELDRALEIRDARLAWLGVDPQLDILRADTRFSELLRGINYPAIQK